jgi:Raf kinase inhibitor-like YbhB/YbcL family protein
MFSLVSKSYKSEQSIPLVHAHRTVSGGKNVSPEFSWTDPPPNTRSFALSIIDPHPVARNWIHWFLINIPFRDRNIPEGASRTERLPLGSKELKNSYNEFGYGGPAPPSGSGAHPYVATLYALNVESLSFAADTPLSKFLRELEGKVIAEASMVGYYERK